MAVTRTVRTTRRRTRRNMVHRKKRAPTNRTLNKKIKHIENNLMELKHLDTYAAGTTITSAGVQFLLNGMLQGDTNITRTGVQISPTSIQVKMQFITDVDQVNTSNVRAILFWDRQPNGAVPALSGVNGLLDITVVLDPTLAPHNYEAIERYTVLFDRVFNISPEVVLTTTAGATTQVLQKQRQHNFYRKLSRQVKYTSVNSAAITSINTNSLYLAFFTDAALDEASVNFGARLYFRDA